MIEPEMPPIHVIEEPRALAFNMLALQNWLYYPHLPDRQIGHYEFTGIRLTVTITHRLIHVEHGYPTNFGPEMHVPLEPPVTQTWPTTFGQWSETFAEAAAWVYAERYRLDWK